MQQRKVVPKVCWTHVSGAKGMFGGMFGGLQGAVSDPKSFVESMGGTVRDGNKGIMTPELQKEFENLMQKEQKQIN